MKFFLLILLIGVASASLLEIYPNSEEEDFLLKEQTPRANEKVTTELGKKLRDLFDHIVDRIKQSVEEGKHIREDLVNKAKAVLKKLKDFGVHVSDEAKTLLEELDSKYHKWAKELLDIIHGKKSYVQRKEDDLKTEFGRKLKAAFERIVKRINQTVEEGKHVSKKLIEKAKDLARKLKKYGVEVSDEVSDLLHYLKERVSSWVKELLDIIREDNTTAYYSEPEVKTELAKELRKKFEDIVRRIKKLVEEGNHVSEKLWDEAKELARELKKYGVRVSDEVNEMLSYLEERATRWIDELLDIIRGDKSTVYYSEPEVKTELAKELREELKRVINSIRKLVEEGKHVSEKMWKEAKDLAKKLKEYGVNVKDEIFDIFEYLKKRGHSWVRELLDILRGKKEAL